jgi:hypothetical protein
MTPKEKARELFDKYQIAGSQWYVDTTKKYALIAVDEIFTTLYDLKFGNALVEELDYWEEVKQEIENLKTK